jgi:hypothetical protein
MPANHGTPVQHAIQPERQRSTPLPRFGLAFSMAGGRGGLFFAKEQGENSGSGLMVLGEPRRTARTVVGHFRHPLPPLQRSLPHRLFADHPLHQHINVCKAPMGQKAAYFVPEAKFGLRGSITTKEACEAAGGQFYPHLFGWMVHVYPYEKEPRNVWSTDDDDQGHDNMDRSAMAGMKMN